jgi:hypothetical protein
MRVNACHVAGSLDTNSALAFVELCPGAWQLKWNKYEIMNLAALKNLFLSIRNTPPYTVGMISADYCYFFAKRKKHIE